ncbi:MAG: hypothetical protein RIS94_636 [Pseudomonadota bacterium]|jgi:AAHS family 4-hydroxybenzoate transporter-like MFS transporter
MGETEQEGVNVAAMLADAPWSGWQKGVLALLSLAYLVDGIANQSLGLAVPVLMKAWGLPREAFAPVAAIGLLGLTMGAVGGGVLGDRIGRRPMMVGSVAVFGVLTFAQGWAGSLHDLLWLRLADGLFIGAMIPNGAALIAEYAPRSQRAVALAIGMTFIAVGAMMAGMIGAVVIPAAGWQGLFHVLGGVAVAVALVLAMGLPESPIHLANRPGCHQRLRKIAARCGLTLGEGPIMAGPATGKPATGRLSLDTLFADGVGPSTIALWIAFFFCLLANYAMFSWVPAMLAALGFALSLTSLGMTALSFGGIVGGVASGWMIREWGSRGTVLGLAAGGIVAATVTGLVVHGKVDSLAVIFALLALIGFFTAGLLNGLYTFSAFIYPDHARGTGVGAAAAAGRVGAIASSWAGVVALGMGGAGGYFLLIAGALAIAFVAVAMIRHQIPGAA